MKRNLYLLPIVLLLASCGSNEVSKVESSLEVESSLIEDVSSEENSSIKESETTSQIIDLTNKEEFEYVPFEELYLQPNESYYLSKMFINDRTYCDYASDISSYLTIDEDNGIITANEVDEFNEDCEVVGSLYLYDETKYQQITIHIVDKEEFGDYFMSVDLGRLYGKNVIFFGDSITHNWLKYPNGDDSYENDVSGISYGELGYNYSYVVRLNNACNFNKVVNAAWSGGTMAYMPKSPIRKTYKSFPSCVEAHEEDLKDMDYVFVFYGTNDLQDQVPIGTLQDKFVYGGSGDCKFKPSMKYSIERIQEINPNAKIIFFNILFRTYAYTGTITEKDYNDAIASVCQTYMVKMIDLSTLFDKSSFGSGGQYTTDGLHPNDKGYEVIANYILNGQK